MITIKDIKDHLEAKEVTYNDRTQCFYIDCSCIDSSYIDTHVKVRFILNNNEYDIQNYGEDCIGKYRVAFGMLYKHDFTEYFHTYDEIVAYNNKTNYIGTTMFLKFIEMLVLKHSLDENLKVNNIKKKKTAP